MMRKYWWKILTVVLLLYTVIAGILLKAPRLPILHETIRALHFHVPMWFGMIIMLTAAMVCSIRYLRSGKQKFDIYAKELTQTGLLFGVLGLLTGMVWARFTWGAFWSGDPKQNGTAIGLLIYLAYMVLRGALEDEQQRGRIGAVYNIFAYAAFIPLVFILPRMTDSLHPGNGGNPGFNAYDLDSNLRKVFYPAVIGWSLMGVWLSELRIRIQLIKQRLE